MTIDADNSKLYSNGQIGWNVQANTLYADFHGDEALFGARVVYVRRGAIVVSCSVVERRNPLHGNN